MLLKLPCRLGTTDSIALIQAHAIVAVVPKFENTEIYVKNIATPILVLKSFESLQDFFADLHLSPVNALSIAEFTEAP